LAGLPFEGSPVEAWRSDEEALRSDIAFFADSNPGLKVQVPDTLPASPDHQALSKQLDALNAAVNQVIRRTPGTPFNLGQVEVTVTAAVAEASPVP
jgi:hypothetical protein